MQIKMNQLELAKHVIEGSVNVMFGTFGAIDSSAYFPPRTFLNEFLRSGSDPADQDGRMKDWIPFELNEENYERIKEWWIGDHPDSKEDYLGMNCWNDWIVEVIHGDD